MKLARGFTKELFAGLLAFSLFGAFIGCELNDSPNTDDIDSYFESHPYVSDPRVYGPSIVTITPVSVGVSFVGEEVAFIGKGGDGPYHWDVSVPSAGHVTVRGWSQCIYTVKDLQPNDVIVYDQNGHAAIAKVIVGSSTNITPTPTPTPTPLTVSPTSATLNNFGDWVTLTATGGTAPYSWSVANLALGNLDTTSGGSVIYTRSFSGNNIVTVTDNTGTSRTVPITQP